MTTLAQGTWLLALLSLLPACGGPRLGTAGPLPGAHIALGSDVLVLPTADFVDDEKRVAAASGSVATAQWRQMLEGSGLSTGTAESGALEEGLRTARQGGFDYVLESVITDWNDATSEWKERPDRVALRARLFRATDGVLVAWGYDEAVGATSDDKVESTHRLLQRVIRKLLTAFLEGPPLAEPPPEA